MKKYLVKATLGIILVNMDHDVVERMCDEYACFESPEDFFVRVEGMMADDELSENLETYLQDYMK